MFFTLDGGLVWFGSAGCEIRKHRSYGVRYCLHFGRFELNRSCTGTIKDLLLISHVSSYQSKTSWYFQTIHVLFIKLQ